MGGSPVLASSGNSGSIAVSSIVVDVATFTVKYNVGGAAVNLFNDNCSKFSNGGAGYKGFAGGGGGGAQNGSRGIGNCGGGNASGGSIGANAVANSGSGGGGCRSSGTAVAGGNGGSGYCLIAWTE
jgi:hypothetical protein